MTTFWGLTLITFSVITLIVGDRSVKANEGKVSRVASLSSSQVKLVKWASALVAFWFGVSLLLNQ